MRKQVFVSPSPDGWKVKSTDAQRAAAIFEYKIDAIEKGIGLAKNKHAELRVQNLDGRISLCNSYGNDPKEIKG